MNLRPRRSEDPEVNLTPLIDVVFLLLVFFMVSTTFVREGELDIVLPEADIEAMPEQERALEVTVDAEGRYFVNERELVDDSAETLREAIQRTVEDERDLPVTIRADAETSHQAVVRVMDVAGQMGFSQIQVVTAEEEAAAEGQP